MASSRNPFNRTRMSCFRLCFPASPYSHATSSAMAHSFDVPLSVICHPNLASDFIDMDSKTCRQGVWLVRLINLLSTGGLLFSNIGISLSGEVFSQSLPDASPFSFCLVLLPTSRFVQWVAAVCLLQVPDSWDHAATSGVAGKRLFDVAVAEQLTNQIVHTCPASSIPVLAWSVGSVLVDHFLPSGLFCSILS